MIDRGFIVRNQAGVAVRMVGAITDVSARRELEERLLQAMSRPQDAATAQVVVVCLPATATRLRSDSREAGTYGREGLKPSDRG